MKGWKKERIIRVLLNHPDGSLTMYRVAKEAETHHSWAIKVIKQLEKNGQVKGTKVINVPGLFDFWLSIHKKPRYREYHSARPIDILREAQDKQKLDFALTTHAGENVYQRYLFLSRYDIYMKAPADLSAWEEIIVKKGGLRGGGNLRLIYDADSHVFYKSMKLGAWVKEGFRHPELWNFPVVSIPQLILDLMVEGGPCTEAADLLIKKHFGGKNVRKV